MPEHHSRAIDGGSNPAAKTSFGFGGTLPLWLACLFGGNIAYPLIGVAVWGALVCGIMAIAMGLIGLYRSYHGHVGRVAALVGLLLGVLMALPSASALLLLLVGSSDYTRPALCQSNLEHIGGALLLYAKDHDGHFPPDIGQLVEAGYVSNARWFVCPASHDQETTGATTRELAANLLHTGRCSYRYVARWSTTQPSAQSSRIVVMYEPLGNHKNGINVLYADGHVAWLWRENAVKVLTALEIGQNPPEP